MRSPSSNNHPLSVQSPITPNWYKLLRYEKAPTN